MRGNRLNTDVHAMITESTCTPVLQSNWQNYEIRFYRLIKKSQYAQDLLQMQTGRFHLSQVLKKNMAGE